jgi:formylmethanofuran dehydrogenase subunit E
MYSSDPNLDFLEHDAEAEHWLERRPVCSICGEHIQDDIALRLDGEWICDGCVAVNRQWIDDYDE